MGRGERDSNWNLKSSQGERKEKGKSVCLKEVEMEKKKKKKGRKIPV